MKTSLLLALSLSLASFPVLAETATLKQNMKRISTVFKSIGKNITDSTQNKNSAIAAGQLVAIFQTTLMQVPKVIASVPDEQKAAAQADYQRIINDEINEALALQNALATGDNAAAQAILSKMTADKKEGHAKYHP